MTAAKSPGFSLLEIIIAITIMALLAVTLGPTLMNVLGRSKDKKVDMELRALKNAVEQYYADTNQFPQRLEDLYQKPINQEAAKKWRRPYFDVETANIKDGKVCDPWDQPYQYRQTKGAKHQFELYSTGDPENPGRFDAWRS